MEMEMDRLSQDKRWLFNENMRLEHEKKELEEERKLFDIQKELILKQKNKYAFIQGQLEAEKMLYDRKWQELDNERRKLELEREKFLDEQQKLKKLINDEKRRIDAIGTDADPKLFFKGIRNGADLRKRYKELTKIFHPDNPCGSAEVIAAINEEYEALKRYYIG